MNRPPLEYEAADGTSFVELKAKAWHQIDQKCRRARGRETGGILVGSYSADGRRAVVERASGPGKGSTATPTRFFRGTGGLQSWLTRLWKRNSGYYLGEWHLHPGGRPDPSRLDREQMQRIANDPAYNCPEPVLVVVGGYPPVECELVVEVYRREAATVRLRPSSREGAEA